MGKVDLKMKIKKHSAYYFIKYTGGSCFLWLMLACLMMLACHSPGSHGKTVFRYNEQAGIATLDPAFAKNQSIIWAVHQLYNTLVETDNNLNIAPSLAYGWDVSPDRTIYTFHL